MKLHTPILATFPLLFCCAMASHAEDRFAYGQVGGLGATIGVGSIINENFRFRAGIAAGAPRKSDRNMGGNNYDLRLKPGASMEGLVDWYPYAGNGFRVTSGLLYMSNLKENIKANPDAAGSYTINNQRYSATDVGTLSGKTSFNKFAPYLGVGWESLAPSRKGWRFVGDAGVMLLTGGKTSLSALGAADNSALAQDVEAERNRVAAASGNSRRGLLTLSLGAGYTF